MCLNKSSPLLIQGYRLSYREARCDKGAPISLIDIKRVQDECFRIKDEKRLIIALISDTGMRLTEALGLSWDDVNIEHPYPHIKLKPHLWRSLKTASSSRVVPLVGASYKAINLNK